MVLDGKRFKISILDDQLTRIVLEGEEKTAQLKGKRVEPPPAAAFSSHSNTLLEKPLLINPSVNNTSVYSKQHRSTCPFNSNGVHMNSLDFTPSRPALIKEPKSGLEASNKLGHKWTKSITEEAQNPN